MKDLTKAFTKDLIKILEKHGYKWEQLENRITSMDNNNTKGMLEITFKTFVPYLPEELSKKKEIENE